MFGAPKNPVKGPIGVQTRVSWLHSFWQGLIILFHFFSAISSGRLERGLSTFVLFRFEPEESKEESGRLFFSFVYDISPERPRSYCQIVKKGCLPLFIEAEECQVCCYLTGTSFQPFRTLFLWISGKGRTIFSRSFSAFGLLGRPTNFLSSRKEEEKNINSTVKAA